MTSMTDKTMIERATRAICHKPADSVSRDRQTENGN